MDKNSKIGVPKGGTTVYLTLKLFVVILVKTILKLKTNASMSDREYTDLHI